MVVTLTGDNSFALKSELKKYLSEAAEINGDLAIEQIDCSEAEIPVVINSLCSLPFLSPEKLIVLRNPSKNADLASRLPELIEQRPDSNSIVIVEDQPDKRTALYKFLKQQTDFKEFKSLDPASLINWVVSFSKEQGANISTFEARYLIERTGGVQEKLSNEINKLALYDKNITKESINLLTDAVPGSSIFDLLEAAFDGNRNRVIRLYDEQRQLKVEPQQIMSMLTWQLHVFLVVKTAVDRPIDSLAREAGINPYVLRKSLTAVKQLSLGRIGQLVDKLLKLDLLSKTKNIDLDDGLTHYLLSI